MKQLTLDDITWTLAAEQDSLPIRGYCMVSGDDELDEQVARDIEKRLEYTEWAWALVSVVGEWEGIEATAYLGGCSYKDEADFRSCDYFESMQAECLAEIHDKAKRIVDAMADNE